MWQVCKFGESQIKTHTAGEIELHWEETGSLEEEGKGRELECDMAEFSTIGDRWWSKKATRRGLRCARTISIYDKNSKIAKMLSGAFYRVGV